MLADKWKAVSTVSVQESPYPLNAETEARTWGKQTQALVNVTTEQQLRQRTSLGSTHGNGGQRKGVKKSRQTRFEKTMAEKFPISTVPSPYYINKLQAQETWVGEVVTRHLLLKLPKSSEKIKTLQQPHCLRGGCRDSGSYNKMRWSEAQQWSLEGKTLGLEFCNRKSIFGKQCSDV